ncbi:RHS repeat-associated core domain-containing protein [Paenibacillus agilis]|uniref:RHS repeat protein n=1 Tax=Paenibacillus agilis TaxID=3020863 RepID=A0A559IX19_9BACL|nr:RHS repeat-associated core domain-containing protein [Paenibacillus agilis]TVX92177.1 RHS repeat protein [Paenibacillus agilis]
MKKMRKLSALLALIMFLELAAPLFMQVAEAVAAPKSVSTQTADNKALLTIDYIAKKYNVSPSDILLRLNEGYSLKHVHDALAKNPEITALEATLEEMYPGVGKKYEPPAVTDATYGLQIPGFNLPFPNLGDVTGATYGDLTVTESVYSLSRRKRSVNSDYDKLALINQHVKLDQAPYSVSTGVENISTQDGSLSLRETDIGIPGRNGLSFNLTRMYNSNEAEYFNKDVRSTPIMRFTFVPMLKVKVTRIIHGNNPIKLELAPFETTSTEVRFDGRHVLDIPVDYSFDLFGRDDDLERIMKEKYSDTSKLAHTGKLPGPDNSTYYFEMYYTGKHAPVQFDVVNHFGWETIVTPKKMDDQIKLGKGWKWDIPYIQIEGENKYISLPGGAVYKIVNDKKLEGYPWDDLTFEGYGFWDYDNGIVPYKLTYKNGMTYTFDRDGTLHKQTDAYGNSLYFTYRRNYKEAPYLTEVRDPIGNKLTFTYEGNKIVVSNGKEQVTYQKAYVYDEQHNVNVSYLHSVTDTAGRTTYYSHQFAPSTFDMTSGMDDKVRNDYALINGIFHPTGAKTLISYDSVERAHEQTQYRVNERKDVVEYVDGSTQESNKNTIKYEYDYFKTDNNSQYRAIISNGIASTTDTYKKAYSSYGQDKFYNIETIQDTGAAQHIISQFFYEGSLNPYPWQIITRKRSGGVESPSLTINRSYNMDGNITSETNSLGASTTTTFDKKRGLPETITTKLDANQQTITRLVRNDKGSVTDSKTYANTEDGQLLSHINYEYDEFGNVTKVTAHNDKGKSTVFRYQYGAEYQHGFLTQQEVDVTNVDGQVSTIVEKAKYDPATGRLLSYTDGKQQTTSYAYDVLGRTTLVTMPNNSQISYVYNDAQNHIQVKNTLGEISEVWFDSLGRKVKETQGLGQVKYGYDERTSQLQWTEDAYGNRTTYAYDGFGRPLQTTYANGTSDRVEYDDAKLTVTAIDAEQNLTKTTSDVLGRTILVEALHNKQNYVPVQRTEYNLAGGVTSATDANGNRTEYQYNAGGQLTAVTDAQKQTTSYHYDRLGNLLETTYANQQKMKKEYDELGRVIKKINGTEQVQKYYYDANSNLEKYVDHSGTVTDNHYNVMNQLVQNTVGNETLKYSYDTEGRPVAMTDHRGTTSYEYQARSGFLTSIQYPDGVKLTNNYDLNKKTGYEFAAPGVNVKVDGTYNNVNQLKQLNIMSGGNQPAKTISYDHLANGQLAKQTYGNAFVTDYQYEDMKLKKLNHAKDGTAQNTFQYGYDLVGNITQRNENSYTTNFTYTSLNQIQTSSEFDETYSYDERYNRQTLDSTRAPSIKSAQYEYDKKNRLTKVTGDHNPVTYSYTGEGLLYERVENNVKNRYYYDANKLLLAEAVVGADGKAKIKYVYLYDLNGKLIGRQDAATSQLQYYQLNGHGDVIAIVDEAGKKLNEYRYDIWGLPLEEKETVPNILKYSGEYWDKTTGLQYLRARWYDPSMGRFISEDTYEGELINPSSLNLYTYVMNNPLKYIDPSGNVADTVADIGFIGYDLYQLFTDPSWENAGYLALDTGAAFFPFVTGAGATARGVKGAKNTNKVSRATSSVAEFTVNMGIHSVKNKGKLTRWAVEHIFKGHSNKGWHYLFSKDAIENGNKVLKVRKGFDKWGSFEAEVSIGGTKKQGYSTFFSPGLSPQQVVDVINSATVLERNGTERILKAKNGMHIKAYYDSYDNIVNAFPIHESKMKKNYFKD